MSPLLGARRFPWENLLSSTALLVVARAVLFAAQDPYWARGLHALAANCFARDVLGGVPIALAGGTLLVLASRGRSLRLLAGVAFAVPAYLFLTARLPADPLHVPGFHDLEARAAHGGAALLALAWAGLLVFRWPRARAARVLALGSCVFVLLALGVRVSGPRTSSAPRDRPNVILISLDTLRADRLGCYGYPRGTSPNIDRFFGQQSRLFRAAFAPQPFTLTSHMSLVTGLNPSAHGVGEKTTLSRGIPTLAEHLSGAGYLTLAQVDEIVWLHPRFGFARGFQDYRRKRGNAATRVPSVEALLDDLEAERFFLFLHFYDAHSDPGTRAYESDAEDRLAMDAQPGDEFRAGAELGGGTGLLWAANQGERVLTEAERVEIGRQYDASVRTLDRALGRLFDHLADRGLLEDTLVILLSDHGEELFEHGKWLHTQLYDESVRVPLLFRMPGRGPGLAPEEREEVVSLVDVMPTVLELCGIGARGPLQGESLVPLLDGAGDRRHSHVLFEWEGLGLRTREWKLLTRADGDRLYGLRADPEERTNLVAAPEAHGELTLLRDELRAESARSQALGATLRPSAGTEVSADERETLRALGYVGGDRKDP